MTHGASLCAAASFSNSARGTTGAQFLEVPVDARAVAMGTAQGAAVRGASALYYNPAALAGITGGDATFMHSALFEGITYDYLSIARSWGGLGTFALGAQYLTPGSLSEVDNTGVPTGASFSPSDLAASLGFGRAWGALELGFAAKHISSKIQGTASGFGLDAGSRYRTGPFALSMSLSNLGQGLQFHEKKDPLPTTIRLGSSYDYGRWLFALDAVAPKGTAPYPAAGAEYRWPISERMSLAGRAGYYGRLMQSELGGIAGLTFGGGIESSRLRFDYALALYGELGVTHRLSVGMSWGGGPKASRRKAARPRDKNDFAGYMNEAKLLMARGLYDQAAAVLDAVGRTPSLAGPNGLALYAAKGDLSRLRGDCRRAQGHYLSGLYLALGPGLTTPSVARCYAGIGLCLTAEKKVHEAAVYFHKGLEANPDAETRRVIENELTRLRAGKN